MEVAIKRHRTVYLLLTFALLVALGLSGCQRGSANPPTLEPTAVSTSSGNIARPDPTNSPAPVPTDTQMPVSDPSTSPSPSAISTPVPNGVYFPCDVHLVYPDPELLRSLTFIEWTPDGSRLIFNEGNWEPGIMIASADGSSIRTIVDATPHPYWLPYGYHADISPDGSQLIYTTCQFPTKVIDPVFTGGEWYHYEIASIRLDGGEPKRLTQNRLLDHVPVWSPDGTRIAYVADPPRPNFYYSDPLWKSTRLYTMAADGRDKRDVAPSLGGVTLSPPQWSPDGQRLSFIVEEEGEEYQRRRFLYTVALDGSKLQRISETATSPSWSPNGKQLVFSRKDVIYTVNPDGTDERKLVDAPGVQQVSWSPDGKEILFVAESAYVVRPDGNGLTKVYSGVGRAAWSPDGSRIAFYDDRSGRVVSVARDGTDLRVIAELSQDVWQQPAAGSSGRVQIAQAVREPPARYVVFTLSNSSTTGCAGGGVSSVTPMADAIEMAKAGVAG